MLIADHAMRISGGRKDNSQALLYQIFQVFQVFQLFHCFKCARYLPQIPSMTLAIIFGIAELLLRLVGGVDAVADDHSNSWMILFLFVFLFTRRRKGCESSWSQIYRVPRVGR